MLTATPHRVPRHTADHVNRAIRDQTERSVEYFRSHPEQIPNRLAQLDREWDVERQLGFRTPSEIERERCALEPWVDDPRPAAR